MGPKIVMKKNVNIWVFVCAVGLIFYGAAVILTTLAIPPRHSLVPCARVGTELSPGCRLQLLGDQFVRNNGGEAIIVSATERLWRYRLRLDSGSEVLVRLDSERFRLLRFDTAKK